MSYWAVLRSRRVRTLWSSQALSVLGDRIFTLAVMWMVWAHTGSAVLMGAVAIAESVPYIMIGLFGRRLMRWSRTLRQLAGIDFVRGCLVFALPLVFSSTVPGVAALLVLVFLAGALTALFDPSMMARLPREAPDADAVVSVYGLFDLSARVARVAGPALAGVLLLVLSNTHLLWLNAATFLYSAVVLLGLARSQRAPDPASQPTTHAGVIPARKHKRPRLLPQLRLAFTVHGVNVFAYGTIIALPALIAARLDDNDPAVYGAAIAAYGLGAVAMNPIAARVARRATFLTVYCVAAVGFGLALAALAAAPNTVLLIVLMFAGGATSPFSGISLLTFVTAAYPDGEERRHVLTTDQTIIRTSGTIGIAFFPALATLSPPLAFASAGLLAAVVAAAALCLSQTTMAPPRRRNTRSLRRLPVRDSDVLERRAW